MNSYAVFILFATRFPSYTSGQPLSNNLLTPTDEVRNLRDCNLNEQGGTGKWYIDSELKSCAQAVLDSKEACDAVLTDIISDGGILRDRNLNEEDGTGKWFIDSVLDDGCYSCVQNVWPLHATSETFFDSKEACDTYLDDWKKEINKDLGGRNLQEQQTESKSRALRGGHFSVLE